MRIVAGDLRGRAIDAPQGEGTRPTIDRVREALFSSLFSLRGGYAGAVVLDAFAGSGALGIEALSRGARHATFCEQDAKAADVVKRNLAACGLGSDRATVVKRDVFAFASHAGGGASPFDLVFFDPPYAYEPDRVLGLLGALAAAGALAPDALVVYEHDEKSTEAVARAAGQAGLELLRDKRYGKTHVTILKGTS